MGDNEKKYLFTTLEEADDEIVRLSRYFDIMATFSINTLYGILDFVVRIACIIGMAVLLLSFSKINTDAIFNIGIIVACVIIFLSICGFSASIKNNFVSKAIEFKADVILSILYNCEVFVKSDDWVRDKIIKEECGKIGLAFKDKK